MILSSDKDLKKLLDRLITDIVNAGGFARLCRRLAGAHPEYEVEIGLTPGFWSFCADSFREACLMRLARVYDQDEQCLCLSTLLHVIGQHAHYFEDDAVLRRVSAAYVEEFKPGSHKIDKEQLDADIALVSHGDPLVKRLVVWRSNYGAHLSTKPVLRCVIQNQEPLSEEDVFTLVDRTFDIYNRYLVAFEGVSFSNKIIGEDDERFLFELLRLGWKKYEAEHL